MKHEIRTCWPLLFLRTGQSAWKFLQNFPARMEALTYPGLTAKSRAAPFKVIPAKASHVRLCVKSIFFKWLKKEWIPFFKGMTTFCSDVYSGPA
ncbi:MAG: hypothetical protein KUA37_06320 [Desulfomicrobium sp.]|nr:hypothetical protein [Pseudomonadota bacterium]MBV1711607.1 hypothetical protein [Desulfomicrobium sp.]MBU4569671.1 hypothetical protein [Pseudomonadota bacterium]MBU4595391.1 hypothetical protein [Pseudomonadota bacterium]MBV1718682.1 hypothetical protein [Desulfomicrobium sp.]